MELLGLLASQIPGRLEMSVKLLRFFQTILLVAVFVDWKRYSTKLVWIWFRMKLVAFKAFLFLLQCLDVRCFWNWTYSSSGIPMFYCMLLVTPRWWERLADSFSSICRLPAILCNAWLNLWRARAITVLTARMLWRLTRDLRFSGKICVGKVVSFLLDSLNFPYSPRLAQVSCLTVRWRPLFFIQVYRSTLATSLMLLNSWKSSFRTWVYQFEKRVHIPFYPGSGSSARMDIIKLCPRSSSTQETWWWYKSCVLLTVFRIYLSREKSYSMHFFTCIE